MQCYTEKAACSGMVMRCFKQVVHGATEYKHLCKPCNQPGKGNQGCVVQVGKRELGSVLLQGLQNTGEVEAGGIAVG